MALKFSSLLFIQHIKVKKSSFVLKNKFYNLLLKLLSSGPSSENLCQALYHLIFWNYERVSLLYPSNSSVVSSIINRGNIAPLVLKNSSLDAEMKGAHLNILNMEFLEIFLLVLKLNESDTFKYEMLRMFEIQMNGLLEKILLFYLFFNILSLDLNCDKLLDSNFICWCQTFAKTNEYPPNEISKAVLQIHELLIKLYYYDLMKTVNFCFIR